MNTRHLARAHAPGWTHPYGRSPFSPVVYADGGDGDGSASTDGAPAADPPAGAAPAVDQPRMYDAAYVDQLRKEAASWRTKLRDAEQAQEQRFAGLVDQLKAAGIQLGDKPDADALQASLTAAQTERRDALIRAALYETAAEHGANPAALRDSLSFLQSVQDIDPTDSAALVAAAKAAVAANPNLSAAPAGPARGGADLSGGGGNDPRQLTEDDLSRMSPEEIVAAQDKGLLRNLLGG